MHASHFSLSYGALPNEAGIGIVVPKKIVKSAVSRHRLKRRVREALRLLAKRSALPSTVIVFARAGADSLTSAQANDELSAAFKAILAEST